ncbi:MAG: dipeptidase [Marinilabiliales bacterium]|nr:dipeptidase [Marinilabiliales bacterium]
MEIHNRILTVDTHCDTPMNILDDNFDIGVRNNPPQSRVDFPTNERRWFGCHVFCCFYRATRTNRGRIPKMHIKMANQMIDATYEACNKYSDMAEELATNST